MRSNKPSLWRRSAYALQNNSRGWSDSVTHGEAIWFIFGIGAERSRAFCITVGIVERSGRLRSKSPVADNLFPWVRSRLRHALTHGYSRKSLRDSVIHPYLNRIARTVRPYNLGIKSTIQCHLSALSCDPINLAIDRAFEECQLCVFPHNRFRHYESSPRAS